MSLDVLLMDGSARAALAVCRSLGTRGLKVGTLQGENSLVSESRYCSTRIRVPHGELTVDLLNRILQEQRPKLLLPITDENIAIAHKLSLPKGVLLGAPDQQLLEKIQSKATLLKIAASIDLPIPRSALVGNGSSVEWSAFPAILKEALAHGWDDTERVRPRERREKQGTLCLNSKADLESALHTLPEDVPFLLQERIEGDGVGVFALCENGTPLVTFAHRRILEKPPSGGVSVLSESIARDQAPVQHATKLLKALEYTGLAMVEFKGKEPVLMEINPRFWGSLQLSISAGVDFPWLYFLWKCGQTGTPHWTSALTAAEHYQIGKRLRWDLGTLDHLLIRLKNEGLPALKRIFEKNELHLFRGNTVHETFRLDDPLPFFAELGSAVRGIFR